MITRYSSRLQRLDEVFLNQKLQGAARYDRIAGYFCSSILEVAGEAIEAVDGPVRVICNAHLTPEDVQTAAAAERLRQEWCGSRPEALCAIPEGPARLTRLARLLQSGKLQVRVIPDEAYGLIHGKAGVITYPDGRRTAFMGSANETASAFRRNYELIWADDSAGGADWVQQEFDFFWNSRYAVALCDFVIQDAGRLSRRTVVPLQEWQSPPEQPFPSAPSAAVETPLFRAESGLWEHQKYFVELAFRAHQTLGGARFLLADQVGLGKTVQLAMFAKLAALQGDEPVLILVPKSLLFQWQEEMMHLLELPSAVWTGRGWQDENGICWQDGILHCPRRVGLVSHGLVTRGGPAARQLLEQRYACVIVDEAHRARRRGPAQAAAKPQYNHLLTFLNQITYQTRSLLLATATPVQIHAIEAYDLIHALGLPAPKVMGDPHSHWNRLPLDMLDMAFGRREPPQGELDMWDIMRNPFPPSGGDDPRPGRLRDDWEIPEHQAVLSSDLFQTSCPPVQDRVRDLYGRGRFVREHSPYLRHIVRRTRDALERTLNPATREPYLKRIEVLLYGEREEDALPLEGPLRAAYEKAQRFCGLLSRRVRGGGFLTTLLLRRIGSTMLAGANTARRLLARTAEDSDVLWEDGDEEDEDYARVSRDLTGEEAVLLRELIGLLSQNQDCDPKYSRVLHILTRGAGADSQPWRDKGCIIFSQYFDSARWLAGRLSQDLPQETIGLYAGGGRSGCFVGGCFERRDKETLKAMIQDRTLKILVGTNAASEGLNLQMLSALINLDLPWNPTLLEQRKGRIQRIGQASDHISIYNMRYQDSVEDRVHRVLSGRLNDIYQIFGQIPDTLEDVWVDAALGQLEQAQARLDSLSAENPFALKYDLRPFQTADWDVCAQVLDREEVRTHLTRSWTDRKAKETEGERIMKKERKP